MKDLEKVYCDNCGEELMDIGEEPNDDIIVVTIVNVGRPYNTTIGHFCSEKCLAEYYKKTKVKQCSKCGWWNAYVKESICSQCGNNL